MGDIMVVPSEKTHKPIQIIIIQVYNSNYPANSIVKNWGYLITSVKINNKDLILRQVALYLIIKSHLPVQ